jgi:aromatic-L-amino-acid decarboxylase
MVVGPLAAPAVPSLVVDPTDRDAVETLAPTPHADPELDAAQLAGQGDMPAGRMREALHAAADLVADYLDEVERYAVLPNVRPSDLRAQLAAPPPEAPQPLGEILRDIEALVVPNVTHWQHPGFFGYFPASASAVGLLGELVTTGLNANAFLWRTSPVGAELESITVDWLRQGLGLPPEFDGLYNDTASTSSLTSLAAARQQATGGASQSGLHTSPPLRVYASADAHSSIERAAMILGIGRDGVHAIGVDERRAMRPDELARAIAMDRAAGWLPAAVVATVGTTSTTGVDPVAEIADICARDGVWLHVDAAYAGTVALLPEMRHHFAGWERADSIVVNPHKWLFTPFDCSLLLTRRMDVVRSALSLVPEYLRTTGGREAGRDYSEYGPQLGRRARGIKMWMLLRYFGLDGLRSRLRQHLAWASELADTVATEPQAELMAPVPFGLVCFRWRPARYVGREAEPQVAAALDQLNEAILDRVNADGRAFLSHTRIDGRFTLRLAIGNIRTERRHVQQAWQVVRDTASALDAVTGPSA